MGRVYVIRRDVDLFSLFFFCYDSVMEGRKGGKGVERDAHSNFFFPISVTHILIARFSLGGLELFTPSRFG